MVKQNKLQVLRDDDNRQEKVRVRVFVEFYFTVRVLVPVAY
jgi:hypothetical protein